MTGEDRYARIQVRVVAGSFMALGAPRAELFALWNSPEGREVLMDIYSKALDNVALYPERAERHQIHLNSRVGWIVLNGSRA